MLTTLVTILYVLVCVVMILVVLLQAGKGGMGSALGGGASQSVFGGSGGADFLAKLTQTLAAGFMLGALYLAYASTHTGSDRLEQESERLAGEEGQVEKGGDVDYERVGPNPLPLPAAGGATPAAPVDDAAAPEEAGTPPSVPG